MLARLGLRISAVFRATAPDPFVIAVLLTAAVIVASVVFTDYSVSESAAAWSADGGVWRFLSFGMQMCLILVTGHTLAASRPVRALITTMAKLPQSGRSAAALVLVAAAGLSLINWGLGLIGGALLARDTARSLRARGVPFHYPLLAAAGYAGFIVWHGGFSGTAPLKVSTVGEIADVLPIGVELDPIPITETILSPLNLVVTLGVIGIAAGLLTLMSPDDPDCVPAPDLEDKPISERGEDRSLFVRLLEDTPIVNWLLAAIIASWAWGFYFPAVGPSGLRSLTPNSVNLTMLLLGLLLHGSPRSYVRAVEDAASGCSGIILQFPLYAGIMGVMHSSGLTGKLAGAIASVASVDTLPVFTCLSAGVVNLFVPSGGGQWGVQGPIAIQSALDAGVDPAKIVMAVAYGDQLTNMLQPFWALPLLAITRIRARDIVGYTAVVMVAATVWTCLCLLIL
ncbi:MAG: TIGR00366 family protein [Planctomycetota bacterium]